ncbi:unnamed protein product, partial [marine sediment metagenome]
DLGSSGKDNIFGLGRLKLSKEIEEDIQLSQEEANVHIYGLTRNKNHEVTVPRDELRKSVVLKRSPIYFRHHKSLGWMYLQQGFKEKALEEFLKAIEIKPWHAELYFEVGKIYKEKMEKKKAIFYLEKYIYLGGKEEAAKELLESLKKKQAAEKETSH